MPSQLARVRWATGQTLMPEDLVALEDALLADTQQRLALTGPPFHGVAGLEYAVDGEQLRIDGLRLVLPSGELLVVPGNAELAAPLDLGAKGSPQVSVFLHREPDDRSDDAPDRRVVRLRLSTDRVSGTALHTVELARFDKSPDGIWTLDDDYAPPLLRIGREVPFLRPRLARFAARLRRFYEQELSLDLEQGYLSGESLSSARRCVVAVLELQRLLANLDEELHIHPYGLYDELCRFVVELRWYRDVASSAEGPVYRHGTPGALLGGLMDRVLEVLENTPKKKYPYTPFEVKDGLARIAVLPTMITKAEEVFLVIQKQHVADALVLEALKLGAPRRLPTIHARSLRGVPFKRITAAPFSHPFGAESVLLRLERGEEWDHVLKDSAAAFYVNGTLEGTKAYLYFPQEKN
jgi:predicted component of type VI protein secretion system